MTACGPGYSQKGNLDNDSFCYFEGKVEFHSLFCIRKTELICHLKTNFQVKMQMMKRSRLQFHGHNLSSVLRTFFRAHDHCGLNSHHSYTVDNVIEKIHEKHSY